MRKFFTLIYFIFCLACCAYAAEPLDTVEISPTPQALAPAALSLPSDSLALQLDPLPDEPKKISKTLWIKQLFKNGFKIADSTVQYPKFPAFCVKVYKWADRVFNSYDTAYVVSTGKKWKLQLKSVNSLSDYSFVFPNNKSINIRNDHINADIGVSLSFMAVSLGYTFNANKLLGGSNDNRQNANFSFTCALFNVEYNYFYNKGNGRITRFGDYKDGKNVSEKFDNMPIKTHDLAALYYFNHRKYAHAAVTCFSKYQLKSAHSWVLGCNLTFQDFDFDFRNLPEDMLVYIPDPQLAKTRFNYMDLSALGGYAYNWVIKPRAWLINVRALGGLGYKRTSESNVDGVRNMLAASAWLDLNVVYNHRALFVGLFIRGIGSMYYNKNYNFLNTVATAQLTVGCRF